LEIVDYDEKYLEIVKSFSKKTGDIATLSLVDMELIAVAYRFYKQEGFEEKLRKEPPPILEK
jgi:RNA-binding protein NOB1